MAAKTTDSSPPTQRSSWLFGGRRRRNSESSVPTLKELVTGRRNSLSSVEAPEIRANVLRKRPPPEIRPPEVQKKTAGNDERARARAAATASRDARNDASVKVNVSVKTAVATKQPQKPQSRPPPAFYNKVRHRPTFSASAVLRWYTINNDDDNALLKPPPTRSCPPSSAGPRPGPRLTPTPAPPSSSLRPPRLSLDSTPLAMYPPGEDEYVRRTQRASAKMQQIASSQYDMDQHAASMVHRPTAYPNGSTGSSPDRPGGYNVPRRLSNSSASSATSSVVSGSDNVFDRMRSASVSSSQTSIDSWPSTPRSGSSGPVTWANQHANGAASGPAYPWQRPTLLKPAYRRKAPPGELFAALPGEVLELILAELRRLHLRPGSTSCATCWMRDCCAVALSARKFLKYAREALYQHVQLVGHEGPAMKKRTKMTYGSRLVLLRRTLRANPLIAAVVRSLKPPARPLSVTTVAYNDLVASVVMACPNLERLVGFYPTYDHSFQRLFQALSTRQKLKEMNWILEPSAGQRQQRLSPAQNDRWGAGELQPQESQLFLSFHANWRQLTTLVVHCLPGAALSPANLLECTIRSLPSLQNLYLSHVPPTSFNDTSLLFLPALRKLSLNYCHGVTTAGLSALATRPASASLQTLTLIHMDVESLPALARIFSYLTSLETFNMVQTYAPEMPPDEFMMLFPYLASGSLRRLHWDICNPLPTEDTPAGADADTILARSISAGGFPALRALCTPNDPEGLFQALCAPRARIERPADRYLRSATHPQQQQGWQGLGHTRNSSSFSSTRSGGTATGSGSVVSFFPKRPSSSASNSHFNPNNKLDKTAPRRGSTSNTSIRSGRLSALNGLHSNGNGNHTPPASPLFPSPSALDAVLFGGGDDGSGGGGGVASFSNSNLAQSRLAAQARLEAAQRVPRYFVNVVDERGALVEKHGVGAFLGSVGVGNRVRYVLSAEEYDCLEEGVNNKGEGGGGGYGGGATDEGGGLVCVEDLIAGDGGEMVGGFGVNGGVVESEGGWRRKKKKEREKDGRGAGEESDCEGPGGKQMGEGIRDGCTGRWNTFSGPVVDKKDRERWWHQERGRWRGMVLS